MALYEGHDVEHGLARALRHAVGLVAAFRAAAPERYRQVSKHRVKGSRFRLLLRSRRRTVKQAVGTNGLPDQGRFLGLSLKLLETALHPPQFPRRNTCEVRGLSE